MHPKTGSTTTADNSAVEPSAQSCFYHSSPQNYEANSFLPMNDFRNSSRKRPMNGGMRGSRVTAPVTFVSVVRSLLAAKRSREREILFPFPKRLKLRLRQGQVICPQPKPVPERCGCSEDLSRPAAARCTSPPPK